MEKTANRIRPVELSQQIENGAAVPVIDVRTRSEFADGHARGATSLPLDELSAQHVQLRLGRHAGRSERLNIICAGGARAQQAAHLLEGQGMKNVAVVEGGTHAWAKHNLPMQRTSRLPSLERQTQIAIGILILLMLTKGALFHPLFYALVGFLGVGLIVAGVTARCGLSALLARMPWNRPAAVDGIVAN